MEGFFSFFARLAASGGHFACQINAAILFANMRMSRMRMARNKSFSSCESMSQTKDMQCAAGIRNVA